MTCVRYIFLFSLINFSLIGAGRIRFVPLKSDRVASTLITNEYKFNKDDWDFTKAIDYDGEIEKFVFNSASIQYFLKSKLGSDGHILLGCDVFKKKKNRIDRVFCCDVEDDEENNTICINHGYFIPGDIDYKEKWFRHIYETLNGDACIYYSVVNKHNFPNLKYINGGSSDSGSSSSSSSGNSGNSGGTVAKKGCCCCGKCC